MKVFFYGGTFDPPHKGHELIVEYCLEKCDKLILIPNKKSPDKSSNPIANFHQRENMLKILFNNKKIVISDFEGNSNKDNYTYLTINHLKTIFKKADLTMVIGNDQLVNLKKWNRFNFILDEVKILCFNRIILDENRFKVDFIDNIEFVEKFNVNISSSKVRNSIFNKSIKSLDDMLNTKIINYIMKEKIYV
jgi:nicotinate-nucleotide adenylyltransferase|tara:strand:+ start:549 stop:1124 length:576 start_codon:yes stop_codon:yes gene_type:complete